MRRGLLVLALALGVAGCATGPARGADSGGPAPLPASPPPSPRSPAAVILTPADVGLALVAASDGVTAADAANQVPDAADALPLYSSWGWVSESTRRFAGAAAAVDVALLETLRPSGAESAFGFWAARLQGRCPPSIRPLDQCAQGFAGGRAVIVARSGSDVLEITAAGADAFHLAALQAARLAP